MVERADLENRFTYHAPVDGQIAIYQAIREEGLTFARLVDQMAVAESREKALALTKIEEAVMWANAAVARHG